MVQKDLSQVKREKPPLGICDLVLFTTRSWRRGSRVKMLEGLRTTCVKKVFVNYIEEVLNSLHMSGKITLNRLRKTTILLRIGNQNEICIFKYVK